MVAALIVVTAFHAASPGNSARYGWLGGKQGSQQGGFSAAVRPDNGDLIAALDVKFGAGKQHPFLFPAAHRNGKVFDGQNIFDRLGFKFQADFGRL